MGIRFSRGALLSGLLIGCSTTATITHDRGPPMETRIAGGTPASILVYSEGRTYSLPRHEVRDIDHPGNVHVLVGGMLAAYGIFNVAIGFEDCERGTGFGSDAEHGGYCVGLFSPLVVGAGMVLWGLVTYVSSTAAVGDTSHAEGPLLPVDPRRSSPHPPPPAMPLPPPSRPPPPSPAAPPPPAAPPQPAPTPPLEPSPSGDAGSDAHTTPT
jgi:hypothetical protein